MKKRERIFFSSSICGIKLKITENRGQESCYPRATMSTLCQHRCCFLCRTAAFIQLPYRSFRKSKLKRVYITSSADRKQYLNIQRSMGPPIKHENLQFTSCQWWIFSVYVRYRWELFTGRNKQVLEVIMSIKGVFSFLFLLDCFPPTRHLPSKCSFTSRHIACCLPCILVTHWDRLVWYSQ